MCYVRLRERYEEFAIRYPLAIVAPGSKWWNYWFNEFKLAGFGRVGDADFIDEVASRGFRVIV